MIKRLLLTAITMVAITFISAAMAADALPYGYAQRYTITVNDPAALLAAMQKFRSSATGMKGPSGVTVSQFIANGDSKATHSIVVTYPDAAAIDASRALNIGSKDWAEFGASFQAVAETRTSGLSVLLKARIKAGAVTSANPVSLSTTLAVSDPQAFMTAFNKFWDSGAVSAFPGNTLLVNVLAAGESTVTHAVVFQANDMATLLNGMQTLQSSADMAEYLRNAGSFRSVVGRDVSVTLWRSPMPTN